MTALKMTANVRNALRAVLANSREYDPATMQVDRAGQVTARKDADKTFAGNDTVRYLVGLASEMVRQDGSIREGW